MMQRIRKWDEVFGHPAKPTKAPVDLFREFAGYAPRQRRFGEVEITPDDFAWVRDVSRHLGLIDLTGEDRALLRWADDGGPA